MTARLKLYQLVSPALPVGGFSYSEGLEVLVQAGRLAGPEALEEWLRAELQRGGVCVETAALASLLRALSRCHAPETARAAAAELADLDGWLLAQREAPELRAQQRQMGSSLLQLLEDLGWPLPVAVAGPLAWPAAFAWAGHCLGLGPPGLGLGSPGHELAEPVLEEAYLYGWVANQLSAAVRLVPLGPTPAQRLQLQLAPLIAERARQLAGADPRGIWSGGVGAGLAQLRHAELYSRLFRS